MKWGKFFIVLLRNLLLTVVIAGTLLGLFGYSQAGQEGLVNGFSWGVILSLFAAPVAAFGMIYKEIAGGYAGRITTHMLKKDMEDEPQEPGDRDSRW